MKTTLQYGKTGLSLDIPSSCVTIFEPRFVSGLPDEAEAFREAVRFPIRSKPLRELIKPSDAVAVVIPDITRPLPSNRLLPMLFEELSQVPSGRFTIVVGTGSHRGNTREELETMVGKDVVRNYRIVNHDASNSNTMELAGRTMDGRPVLLNKEYVNADKRIVLGFIEPHFMAGFSGGYKGIFPAIADIESILHYHRASVIGDSRSTWGVLEGNPTQERIRMNGSLLPVNFCINVTLNRKHEITRLFCGDVLGAHEEGCKYAKATAMVACERLFPIVVTTNGGYPLDQNLYQTVKGMSAAAQIVKEGGLIITVSKCEDGFPSHGNFKKLLFDHESAEAVLDTILTPDFAMHDQWEAQLLALISLKARVALYSDLPDDDVRKAHLEPVSNIKTFIARELERLSPRAPIAVLPEGPMTIPYLEHPKC
ncbi:MAG: nickel-dependent lactate racemase [Candidatus Latescibacteria bacterium]|nr:nickel-dependent lactate racemase [Candidatus Latescibacterota bacterium]NIM64538.1 nickel-dependent lactate racemase [Candidatus Latescibacterota bacterium]NIO00691.1 nickel-dependent lactate racemase [Candidatus Latescibacterota bacterium]NIO27094.1 nickel-dependent lactate racemase [Candidatus Latescibacterota bacterium]NIO54618.1 nickel-dependent lactate racemase [Candidatus Latescibacterota bacterium]